MSKKNVFVKTRWAGEMGWLKPWHLAFHTPVTPRLDKLASVIYVEISLLTLAFKTYECRQRVKL